MAIVNNRDKKSEELGVVLSDSGNVTPLFGRSGGIQHVVILDDQATARTILESIIRKISPNVVCETFDDPLKALRFCSLQPPDLLLTDYKMPQMDGIDVISYFRELPDCREVPVVMVTIIEDKNVRYRALDAGATDFLTRPIDHQECAARCKNLLLLHQYQKSANNRASILEEKVFIATEQVRKREKDALFCLAKAGEYKDEGTGNHILRMAKYSKEIASTLGMSEMVCDEIESAAPMHDIGKIGIPDHILLKPGKLTQAEMRIMQSHTLIGHDILQDSHSRFLRLGAEIALAHHERFDGTGYPYGKREDEIPIEARVVAIADTLDALTTERPYKRKWSLEDSLVYIKNEAGSHFDPVCVTALMDSAERIKEIHQTLGEGDE